jgi:flagellar hook-associated protein 1 FlgK
MSLSVGLDVALSGLSTSSEQTAIVSRNVARANDPYATRKTGNVVTTGNGGIRIASITRAANSALLEKMLSATSVSASQKAIVESLDQLDQTVSDPELDTSPAAMVQKLNDAIQQYAAAPQDPLRAQSAVAAAQNLADSLNVATGAVQDVRAKADAGVADSVTRINTLLSRFETLNTEIVKGTRIGADVTDYLDQRDGVLASLSEEVGIRTITRDNDDMAVFTDSGVTLFDAKARAVTFNSTQLYSAGTTGNAVYVDGVPITGTTGSMLVGSGRLVGLTAVRDSTAVTYQNQLDEVARGLIEAFAESDQTATPSLPDAPGLFTYAGAPAMPASGTLSVGIAGTIKINPSVDPAQGGNLALLRDGGMAGDPAYVYNSSGGSAFSDRLNQYVSALSASRPFDASAQLTTTATIGGLASSSAAWLQEARKFANDNASYADTVLQRSSDALSKDTGVNIDEEMTSLLELERSYQASTRLITTIDGMLKALLAATG